MWFRLVDVDLDFSNKFLRISKCDLSSSFFVELDELSGTLVPGAGRRLDQWRGS